MGKNGSFLQPSLLVEELPLIMFSSSEQATSALSSFDQLSEVCQLKGRLCDSTVLKGSHRLKLVPVKDCHV